MQRALDPHLVGEFRKDLMEEVAFEMSPEGWVG